jgi:hypothetical protein
MSCPLRGGRVRKREKGERERKGSLFDSVTVTERERGVCVCVWRRESADA